MKLTLYNISDNRLARNIEGGISVNRLIRRKIDGGKPAPSSRDFESTSSDFGGKIPKLTASQKGMVEHFAEAAARLIQFTTVAAG